MPKIRTHKNLLDSSFNLVSLRPGDEIPEWALPLIGDHLIEHESDVTVDVTVDDTDSIDDTNDPVVPPVEAVDYGNLKVKELRAILEERGLDTDGNKDVLVERLQEADATPETVTEGDDVTEGDVDLWSLNETELNAYAAERGIDVSAATSTAELVAILESH